MPERISATRPNYPSAQFHPTAPNPSHVPLHPNRRNKEDKRWLLFVDAAVRKLLSEPKLVLSAERPAMEWPKPPASSPSIKPRFLLRMMFAPPRSRVHRTPAAATNRPVRGRTISSRRDQAAARSIVGGHGASSFAHSFFSIITKSAGSSGT